jgi:hypothetical protein
MRRRWRGAVVSECSAHAELHPYLVKAHAMRGLLATLTKERGLAGHLVAASLDHADERVADRAYAEIGAANAGARRKGLKLLNGGKGG